MGVFCIFGGLLGEGYLGGFGRIARMIKARITDAAKIIFISIIVIN